MVGLDFGNGEVYYPPIVDVAAQGAVEQRNEECKKTGGQENGCVVTAKGKEECQEKNSCKLEVRAIELGSVFRKPYYHLFIIFIDKNGTEYYLRGGPSGQPGRSGSSSGLSGGSSHSSSRNSSASGSNPSDSSSDSPYGYITTEYGQYLPGTIDYDPQAKSIQVASCTESCSLYQKLIEEMKKVNNAHIHYNPLGSNSNSVVFTTLKNIGVIPKLPENVWAPGHDTPISY